MAANLKRETADGSELGSHHRRESQGLSLDDAAAPSGAPAKRMEKLMQDARAPAEIREFMDSGARLNMLRQTDLSTPCVSS